MTKKPNARALLILSMAIFGTLAPFVRRIGVSSGELALYRAILAVVLIGAVLLATKQKIPFRAFKKELCLLLISGAAMSFNWILLFEAYRYTTVSIATISYYFAPVIVIAVCPLLFREKMTKKSLLCFFMATLGIVLITASGDLTQGSDHLLGILLGLGAACLYATVIILNKFIKHIEGLQRTFLQFIAAVAVLIPYVSATGGVTVAALNATGWVCLLFVGIVHTGIAYCLYFSSIKALPGQKAAILSYIDPLVAVILSVLVLGESITVTQIIGGALILGFTLWNELSEKIPSQK